MTGSYPQKGAEKRIPERSGQWSWRVRRVARGRNHDNLLYVRTQGVVVPRPAADLSGALFTLLGVSVGLGAGYLGYRLGLSSHLLPRQQLVVWVMALLALAGGAIGALAAWLRARRHLRQALVTSEGFRQRLMSVERNQALWISLSAVLHDVRNPLHNINLLVEGLRAPGVDVHHVTQQIAEQLDRIHVRVGRVTNQITELSGDICRRPIDLAAVLAEVAEMVRPLARQSRINLLFDRTEGSFIFADPKYLVQAIDHLILNSLQILTECSSIAVRSLWVQVRREAGQIEMWVEDSGPGLPEEVRARLFEPLTTSRTSGMGLGLAIAHALASAAGAELVLGHTGPTGTRFVLRFRGV
ncbi:MAG: sensor histidine kinase [Acidiferrobacter sp.]